MILCSSILSSQGRQTFTFDHSDGLVGNYRLLAVELNLVPVKHEALKGLTSPLLARNAFSCTQKVFYRLLCITYSHTAEVRLWELKGICW